MNNSPFLPGTKIQFAFDSTSLGWLKTCPRLYYYQMIEGLTSKGESVHLRYGQLLHAAFEDYDKYRLGFFPDNPDRDPMDHEAALRQVVHDALNATWDPLPEDESGERGDGAPWTPDHPSKTRETLIRTIIWYLDQFKDDPAKTVILANGKPAVELSFRLELDWGPQYTAIDILEPIPTTDFGKRQGDKVAETNFQPYLLCGHLDRLVEFQDHYYVMDHKTTSTTISQNFFEGFEPDNQMTLYSFAAKVIYNTPVKGVIIDGIQIAVGFSRPHRGFTFRTDAQIEEWLGDLRYWFRQAETFATEGYWPMNDRSCHLYGGCKFRKVCSKDPQVRDIFLKSDFVKKEWNPLSVR